MKPQRIILLAGSALAALSLAACGGGTSPTPSSDAAQPTASSQAPLQEGLVAWAQCMRDNGVNVPDPTVSADGSAGDIRQVPAGSTQEAFDVAMQKCERHLPAPEADPGAESEREESMQQFAQCLRGKGIDAQDPDVGAGKSGQSIFGPNVDENSEQFKKAKKECAAEVTGGSR